jgi:hypothetical protein
VRRLLPALLLVLGLPAALVAQVPDSIAADSARADTLDSTERLLASQAAAREGVPGVPYLGAEGPRVAGTVRVWTRDSLDWSGAETVGDLLARVPGLFVLRGGGLGRPEIPNYLGRGPAAVEYRLDGLPYAPLGPDSTAVDAATLGLALLERVDVERVPGAIRVHLFTRRHDLAAPLSRLAISSGDRDFARYEGLLTRRGRGGFGFGLGAEVLDVPDPGLPAGYQHAQYWGQLSWVPRPGRGVLLQVVGADPDREELLSGADTLTRPLDGSRRDYQLRAFLTRGTEPRATRVDLLLGRSTWKDDTIDQRQDQGGVSVEHRAPRLLLAGSAFLRSGWTTADLRGRGGWAVGPFALAAEGVFQRHRAERNSGWFTAQGSAALPGGMAARVEARVGSIVPAPAIDGSEAESTTDVAGYLGWHRAWVSVEAGLSGLGAVPMPGYAPLPALDSIAPLAATWFTAEARLRLAPWLTLEGWMGAPMGDAPEGRPPFHGSGMVTLRSKFLRQFPSGFFDLRLSLGGEIWDDGVLGHRPDGTPVPIAGNSLTRLSLELQLGRFLAYYHRTNLLGRTVEQAPGASFPTYATTFGVKWEFLN